MTQSALIGGAGEDVLDGGAGFDIVSYASSEAGLTINLLDAAQNTGDAFGDSFYIHLPAALLLLIYPTPREIPAKP